MSFFCPPFFLCTTFWQVQDRKLKTSKVPSNYHCSLLPHEIWSMQDDNMAIHYSLELEGAADQWLEPIKSQTLGIFALTRPTARPKWCIIGKWPAADPASQPVPTIFVSVESSGSKSAGQKWVSGNKLTCIRNSSLMFARSHLITESPLFIVVLYSIIL